MGIHAAFAGDDDGDASLTMSFREVGAAQWTPGHRLLPTGPGRASSSVLFAEPDPDDEVRITLDEPDTGGAQEQVVTARTRADVPAAGTGNHYYVDAATGADTNDGSQGAPFATIQAAANVAGPGATVHVAAGVYRETVTVEGNHGGTASNPVRFVAASGAVLDGSDASLEDGSAFTLHQDDVYWAPFQGECRYVAVNDQRLYDYPSLADLMSSAEGISEGFFVDEAASRIYLRTPDGSSPAGQSVHVASKTVGFLLDTVTDIVIEGFEIRYYGTAEYSGVGVDVRDTSRAWIRNNVIHHMNEGVRVRRETASDNVIEGNEIRDTSVWTWPWDAVKAHTPEASAVSITGAGGNIVRRNVLSGTFNGIYVGTFGDSSEAIADNTDVYENVLHQHGDDGLEPEGACVNVRFWNNAIHGAHNGISLAPIEVGPLFAIRTLVDGYVAHALKINNGPTGWILVYHTTSAPSADQEAQAISPSEPFASFIARNNIWTGHRYVIESSVTPSGLVDFDYDNLYTDSLDGTPRFVKWLDVRYDDLAALKASGTIEGHGFDVVPAYEDPATGDYTPVEGSGLLDVGEVIEGVNDRFMAGVGPDLGAFERGGVSPGTDAGIPDGSAGAGGGGGSAGTGGGSGTGGGAGSGGGTTEPDGGTAGTGSDGGAGSASDYPGEPIDDGCGCRAASGRALDGVLGLGGLWLFAALLGLRRKRGG
jgi:hypothetical protein